MAGQVISEAGKVKYAGMFTGAMHLYLGSCQTDANQSRIRQVCAALERRAFNLARIRQH
jgi:hypothetical protein